MATERGAKMLIGLAVVSLPLAYFAGSFPLRDDLLADLLLSTSRDDHERIAAELESNPKPPLGSTPLRRPSEVRVAWASR